MYRKNKNRISAFLVHAITRDEYNCYSTDEGGSNIRDKANWIWAGEIASGEDLDGDGFIGDPIFGIKEDSDEHAFLVGLIDQVAQFELEGDPAAAWETRIKIKSWLNSLKTAIH